MTSPTPCKLIVFTDSRRMHHLVLVDAFLREARTRKDVTIVALCDTDRRPPLPRHLALVKRLATRVINRLYNPELKASVARPVREGLHGLARRYKVPMLTPPDRNINHPSFLEVLRRDVKADLALSIYCSQIFRPALLDCFADAANVHDGWLPSYRGLGATGWSIYRGESVSGFALHRLTPGIDEGAILLQEFIPIPPDANALFVSRAKIEQAAQRAGEMLDALLQRLPGTNQGTGSYFSLAALRRIRTIHEPVALTYDEWQRRLRAFTYVRVNLNGRYYIVTRVRRIDPSRRRPRLAFATCDGVLVAPSRFLFLPLPLYHVAELLGVIMPADPPSRRSSEPSSD